MIVTPLRQTLHRRQALKLAGALGLGAAFPLTRRGLTSPATAQEEIWDSPPDLARAAEQARDFQTYGMPDDWANYGEVLKAFAETYGFELQAHRHRHDLDGGDHQVRRGEGQPGRRQFATSACIYGPDRGRSRRRAALSAAERGDPARGTKGANGGWVATFTGVPAIIVNTDVDLRPFLRPGTICWRRSSRARSASRDPRTAGEGAVAFLAWAYANGGDENNLAPGIEFAKKMLPQFAAEEGLTGAGEGRDPRCHQVRLQCPRPGRRRQRRRASTPRW